MRGLATFATMVVNLFLIVDPVGSVPLLAAITERSTPERRRAMIRRAITVAFLVLTFFTLIGKALLDYFGVSLAAVRIAGGILLFAIGLEMLYGRISRTETTEREEQEAAGKEDVSITPLAIPLLAGPGSIAAAILHAGGRPGVGGSLLVVAALAVVMGASWIVLGVTDELLRLLGQIGIKVIARVMGLLLLFLSTQFVIDGIKAAGVLSGL